eukprot:TRINITY_DN47379_c0_g1_i1.p1 TRINITY_DN47379_c0_g1~~TRINITY_DN47379_c0_g1_i1.p1  ORF type:complete len:191 (+),score=59.58 TRINITY_DN47379_c0_g1_i1:88-660(+)
MDQPRGILGMLPLAVLFATRNMDLAQEGYVPHLRVAFLTSLAAVAACVIYIYVCIGRAPATHDTETVDVPEQKQFGQVIQPASVMTIREYDMSKIRQQMKDTGVMVCVLGLMHLKWELTTPLLLQSIMMPLQMFQSPLFGLYIRGLESVDSLARPFPVKSLFEMPKPPEAEEPARPKKEKKAKKESKKTQ